jgi:hypothetical protein
LICLYFYKYQKTRKYVEVFGAKKQWNGKYKVTRKLKKYSLKVKLDYASHHPQYIKLLGQNNTFNLSE